MKRLAFAIICLATLPLVAQIPQVPSKMDFAGMKLTIAENTRKEIQKDVDNLRANDAFFRSRLELVNLYFPFIEAALIESGVPEDFKYLTIQESGLVSDAVSSAKAVGFWQFKDFTGREVGLRIDNRIDERKNVIASTKGAATYLKRNNFYYDNWVYALTAYYAGRGGATKYTHQSEYGVKKMTIDGKTHWYVKRFLAHKIAFEGEIGDKRTDGLKLVAYEKGAGKDLKQIAKELKVDEDLLVQYNKWLDKGTIPDDKEYSVIVPVTGRVPSRMLAEEESAVRTERTIEEPVQTVLPKELKPGISSIASAVHIKVNGVEAVLAGNYDDLNSLAADGGITPEQFAKYNDMVVTNPIEAGKLYYVEKKKSKSEIGFHVANSDESLWDISQKYGISLRKLAKKNQMATIDEMEKDRVVWLNSTRPKDVPVEYNRPQLAKVAVAASTLVTAAELPSKESNAINLGDYVATPETHKVTRGESLWGISRQYGVSVTNLEKWNNVSKVDPLTIGQDLYVSKPALVVNEGMPNSQPAAVAIKQLEPNTINLTNYVTIPEVHSVERGETLWGISRQYGISVSNLEKWNDMSKGDPLTIGQDLFVGKPQINLNSSEPLEEMNNLSMELKSEMNEILAKSDGVGASAELAQPSEPVIEKPDTSFAKDKNPKTKVYLVKPGDTLYRIATAHNMQVKQLMEINQMANSSLSVGEELRVYAND